MRLIITVLAAFLGVGASDAQEFTYEPAPPGGALIGTINYSNEYRGGGYHIHEVQTVEGVVRLRQFVTMNIASGPGASPNCCPDEVRVIDAPPGVVVLPPSLRIEEGAEAFFEIIRFVGG